MTIRSSISVFFAAFLMFSISAFAATSATYTFNFTKGTPNVFNDVKAGEKLEGAMEVVLRDDLKANFGLEFYSNSEDANARRGSESILNMSNWIEYPNGATAFVDGTPAGPQKVKIPFIVNIPDNISPGDYVGAMVIGLIPGDSPVNLSPGAGLSVSTAIGTSLRFSIPGERFHKLEFQDMYVDNFSARNETTEKPQFGLFLKAKSLGNTIFIANLDIKIKDLYGEVIYEKAESFGTIYPGIEIERNFLVDIVKRNPFPGWIDIEGNLSYRLTGTDGKPTGDTFQVGVGKIRVYSLPWGIIYSLALIFSIISMTIFYRRYILKKLSGISKIYTIKENDTLQSVSAKFSVSPENIIRVNKLKSPYFLTAGKEMLIPKKIK